MSHRDGSTRSRSSKRVHLLESLEPRCLLAASPFGTNLLQPLDVSRDGNVSALDALRIINALSRSDGGSADPADNVGNFIDVNQDGSGTALDALRIINRLATGSPTLAVTLPNDSSPQAAEAIENGLPFDLQTNDYAISLGISLGQLDGETVSLRIGDESATSHDITGLFVDNQLSLTQEQIDDFFGEPLPDGDHDIRVEILGSTDEPIEFTLTVDRQLPELAGIQTQRSRLVGEQTVAIELATPTDELFLDVEAVRLEDTKDSSRVFVTRNAAPGSVPGVLTYDFEQDIPEGDYELVIDHQRIATPTGNAVGSEQVRLPVRYSIPTAVWNNPAGGRWRDAENWQSGQVPIEDDVVLIDVPEGVVVEGPVGNSATVQHLTLRGELRTSSNIQAKTISVDRGTMTVTGGSAASDVLYTSRTGAGRILVEDGLMRVDNSIVELPIEVGPGGTLLVSGGMRLNDTLRIAGTGEGSAATVSFGDSQQVTGRGEFQFAGPDPSRNRIITRGEGFVDIASSLTIRGSRGEIDAADNNPIHLQARILDDGRAADEFGQREITISGLGSQSGEVELKLDTPEGLVELDSHSDITLRNRGTAPIEFREGALLTNVGIESPVRVTSSLWLQETFTLNSDLVMASFDGQGSLLFLRGDANVEGDGNLVFAGEPTELRDQRIESSLRSDQPGLQKATIGSGITIRGNSGLVTGGIVDLDLAGTVVGGPESDLVLRQISSENGFQIDSPDGTVTIDSPEENLNVSGIGDSVLTVSDDQSWASPELRIPILVKAGAMLQLTGNQQLGSLVLGSTITLEGNDSERAELVLLSTNQPVIGDGEVVFAGETTSPYGNLLKADLNGESLDPRISIRGRNGLFGGRVRYNGTITVTDDGLIGIGRINGGGQPLTIDSRQGTVLARELEHVTLDGVEDSEVIFQQFADLGFPGDGFDLETLGFDRLTNVTIDLPGQVLGGNLSIHESLELNSAITLVGDLEIENRGDVSPRNSVLQFRDEASVDPEIELTGTGSILFGRAIDDPGLSNHRITSSGRLIVGPEITLGGKTGDIVNATIGGNVVSEPGAIIDLTRVDSRPGVLEIQPQAGRIFVRTLADDTRLITGGPDSEIYTTGFSVGEAGLTLNIPLFVQNKPGESSISRRVQFSGDLQLGSTITLVDEGASIRFGHPDIPRDEPYSITGTGQIVLAIFDPDPDDDDSVAGHSVSSRSALNIGSGITIQGGKGTVGSSVELQLQGTVIDLNGQLRIVGLPDE